LLRREETTGAILQFLKDTDVRKIKKGVLRPLTPDWDGVTTEIMS